jgi:ACS family hexuronate transporter-like MFS transporter
MLHETTPPPLVRPQSHRRNLKSEQAVRNPNASRSARTMSILSTARSSSGKAGSGSGFTSFSSGGSNVRWIVCGLLFLATTINYMDRSVLSLIEPQLHRLPFMGWNFAIDDAHQVVFNNNYKHIVQCFQLAYGIGLLLAGRIIDKLGTKIGYALAIGIWALSSMGHALVFSVTGFCIARFMLGLGESGNFPAAIKATTEWFPSDERATATGLFNSGSNVSFFIAPILVAWATGRYGWQAGFIATGSMGLVWLVLWLLFPYNRLRRGSTQTQANLEADFAAQTTQGGALPLRAILARPGLYAFSIAKGLTDPIWWFYLFYLPKFLNETYGLNLDHAKWEIIAVYMVSSIGSIFGGALSGWRMKQGHSVNSGRKFAMLLCAILVTPIVFVPHMGALFPHNAWPATLLIALAAAAHQGWSANLFATPTDMFPSTAVSTVVGIGGAVGSLGGVIFTGIVGSYFSLHPLLIFGIGASSYLLAFVIFQILVPRLGQNNTSRPNPPTSGRARVDAV